MCGAEHLLPTAGDITQLGQRRQHSCSNRQTGDADRCEAVACWPSAGWCVA